MPIPFLVRSLCGAVVVFALAQAPGPAKAQPGGGDAAQGVLSPEDRLERRQETLERLRQYRENREKASAPPQAGRDGPQEQQDNDRQGANGKKP